MSCKYRPREKTLLLGDYTPITMIIVELRSSDAHDTADRCFWERIEKQSTSSSIGILIHLMALVTCPTAQFTRFDWILNQIPEGDGKGRSAREKEATQFGKHSYIPVIVGRLEHTEYFWITQRPSASMLIGNIY